MLSEIEVLLIISDHDCYYYHLKEKITSLYNFLLGYSRGRLEPDTIVIRGVPSRWFAEPRVSSKPSMLVTHTIFSTFGKIRYFFFFFFLLTFIFAVCD